MSSVALSEGSAPGAGVAAYGLGRLGHLLGEARYLAAAERTLRTASGSIARYASGHCALLRALEEYLRPPTTMVLRGGGELLAEWQRRCTEHYSPARLTFAIPTEASFDREAGPDGALYVGSPETVASKIAANMRALGATRFDLKYGLPGLTHDQLMTTIELYGQQVVPRVRELLG